ncbi:methionine synthase [Corynebacterium sp.]|uniref:methionine synthase n=1 Tax=Corynebacterium sp. TaxID=1720 RepID=UPI002A90D3F5|nr:methionine synthase [Corynebacterium sp.]MDY5784756.1 methionine synthase [Corynebacterium sp.]
MEPRAFGLGELPGTDMVQAADVVVSESLLPHIPQLPERGIGSDLVGRTAALLDIPIDRGPRGWRVASQHRGARDQMARDLDVLEECWGSVAEVKVQLVGPWTLAAEVETRHGHRMITDPGALRDVTEALLEATRAHRAEVEKRFGAVTVLQLDEPRLEDIMRGRLTGPTRYHDIPAVPEPLERLEAFGPHLLHTPALIDAPWLTVDIATIDTPAEKDAVARLVDSGTRLAVAPVEPKQLWRFFEQLQIDPAGVELDVWARPADTLLDAARAYAAAREMAEGLR